MKKGGFTLLELLVVIVVISILATIVVGGANYTLRVAREKRMKISCKTLETAIQRYHTEYNDWPGGGEPTKGKDGKYAPVEYSGAGNATVFGALRASNNKAVPMGNPKGITIIDETAFFTPDGENATKLAEKEKDGPLVFATRSGRWTTKTGEFFYYKVSIDYEFQKVVVKAPGFDDEDD